MIIQPPLAIPDLQKRLLNAIPLAKVLRLKSPKLHQVAGGKSNRLHTERIYSYSGTYDETGRLPRVFEPGSTFTAHV